MPFTNWTYVYLTDRESWQLLMETHPDGNLFQSAKDPIVPLHTHLFILADLLNIGSRAFKTLMVGKLLFSRLILGKVGLLIN